VRISGTRPILDHGPGQRLLGGGWLYRQWRLGIASPNASSAVCHHHPSFAVHDLECAQPIHCISRVLVDVGQKFMQSRRQPARSGRLHANCRKLRLERLREIVRCGICRGVATSGSVDCSTGPFADDQSG